MITGLRISVPFPNLWGRRQGLKIELITNGYAYTIKSS
jgi:hypothetical protein